MSTDLAVIEHEPPAAAGGVFAVTDPQAMLANASAIATQLQSVVKQAGLITKIGGKDYLQVEAWTTLGVLVGCTARTEWTRPVDGGWEAAVEVVNQNGLVIGRAEAECLRTERNWKSRDDFALRSMAQTRAMGKALRMPLGWIAVLAGYQATPAEEMPSESVRRTTGSSAGVRRDPADPPSSSADQTGGSPNAPAGEPGAFVLNFGKHKGKQLHEVPSGYLDWLLENGKPDVQVAIAEYRGQQEADDSIPF